MKAKTDRNLDIYLSKESGETYKSIGDRLNISSARVRQIHLNERIKIWKREQLEKRAIEAKNKIALEVAEWEKR